ncbi:MAG: NPCBM/NEW2 domain-containing protein, partial [Leadbetterella sp.]
VDGGGNEIGRGIFAINDNTDLTKGWYRITLYVKKGPYRFARHKVEFGVGDVYFIAGQSNAAGYGSGNYDLQNTAISDRDNTVSTILNNNNSSPMARVLDNKANEQMINPNLNNPQKRVDFGIPYKVSFKEFKNGTVADPVGNSTDRVCIYPNGYNSWYWAPLAHKLANPNNSHKYSGTPTLWFNVASPSTALQDNGLSAINIWDINPTLNSTSRASFLSRPFVNTLMGKFKNTLETFAGPFGTKGVLWHQGESDHEGISGNLITPSGYQNSLNTIIRKSREYVTGDQYNTSLNWFVSKASLYLMSPTLTNTSFSSSVANVSSLPNYNAATFKGYNNGANSNTLWASSALRDNQISTLGNVFDGPNTDGINSLDSNNQRSTNYFVHFSGNSLNSVADLWYNKLNQTSNSLAPTTPIKINQIVKYSANSYKIVVDNSIGSNEFLWLVDGYGVNGWTSTSTIPEFTFSGGWVNPDLFLHGYAKKNGRWHAVIPFFIPGGNIETKKLELKDSNMPAPSNGANLRTGVEFVDTDWEIVSSSVPTWITVAYDEDESELVFNVSANNSSISRNATIQIMEVGGGLTSSTTITQSGSTSTSIPLTNLTPSTNTAYKLNTNWAGQTMQMGELNNPLPYSQGFGVHADNSLSFNLGGQYTTFSGKVGQEYTAACGDGMTFMIRADGNPIWSEQRTYHQSPEIFSLNVSGVNTLELLTFQNNNSGCDHANWADVYLISGGGGCSTPPQTPSPISATATQITSGQSVTLTSSCSIGNLNWSTGVSGTNSITVTPSNTITYTAWCSSGSCPNSNTVSQTITVQGSPSGPCSALSDNLTLGTLTLIINGQPQSWPLVARYFHGGFWVTQRTGTNPDAFFVRGSPMLNRSDVSLNNPSYSAMVSANCFAWNSTDHGGFQEPSLSVFPQPAGYNTFSEGNTPYFVQNNGCLAAPTNVSASPAGISSGQSSTLSATCSSGIVKWNDGTSGSPRTVSPSSTTSYSVICEGSPCNSPSVSTTVTVGPCTGLQHNMVMGSWNVNGHQLIAKNYHNQWWLAQKIGETTDFLVRGANMLSRGDVTTTYAHMVGCFSWNNSGIANGIPGLEVAPISAPGIGGVWFDTPSGWEQLWEDQNLPITLGTPYYHSLGGARIGDKTYPEQVLPPTEIVSIIPNPNEGDFIAKVYLKEEDEGSIEIMNVSGKVYFSQKIKGKKGWNEIPIQVKGLAAGRYVAVIKTKAELKSTTFIKQ